MENMSALEGGNCDRTCNWSTSLNRRIHIWPDFVKDLMGNYSWAQTNYGRIEHQQKSVSSFSDMIKWLVCKGNLVTLRRKVERWLVSKYKRSYPELTHPTICHCWIIDSYCNCNTPGNLCPFTNRLGSQLVNPTSHTLVKLFLHLSDGPRELRWGTRL